MKDPLGVSPGKGNQGTTRGKEKINSFDLSGNRTHESTVTELILCSTICVHSATRHNIHIYQLTNRPVD